jgi:subtilisin family serine protease
LLSRNSHGGVLQEFLNAEFFSITMTAAQADAMRDDPCSYAVEPNYIIRARGTKKHIRAPARDQKPQGTTILKGQEPPQDQRRLGVPEFNLKDSNPGNWGLERISTRGVRNGKYIWVSEGFGTDVYVFDTGIHDSYEFTGRNITWGVLGPSRIQPAQICAGNAGDEGEHGSFIASIIGGKKYGVARMAAIHPMQILDVNGEGSVATFLCGMDKVIQDGIDYYAANAPKKIKAVVNLSVGTNGKSDILDKAAEDLVALGYTVVVAAGDYAGNSCHYSPSTADAIRVGALKDAGLHGTPGAGGFNEKTDTSNFGQCIDIWAPGEDIVGANEEDWGTVTMSGTSVAAAFVSGTITQFLEEVLSSETPQEMFPLRAKDKMLTRSERDALGDVGVYGTDRVLQTTSSPCLSNIHCEAPKVCLYDGACGILSDYF